MGGGSAGCCASLSLKGLYLFVFMRYFYFFPRRVTSWRQDVLFSRIV